MLGWWIIVSMETPEQRDSGSKKDLNIAHWKAGLGGMQWLLDLVKNGKAEQLKFDGYPCRFIAAARDIFPIVEAGPPHLRKQAIASIPVVTDDRIISSTFVGEITIHRHQLECCLPSQQLTIDVWDES